MFKVLLVDDEPNVRMGIKMMIPWEDIGCEIIGEAEDGDDGLSKIMISRPDIVIADIKMPGKTGIEMTEAAKALGFKGKVIILSGYSDFSYAKTAISLGVENFILKPVDEDELTEAIKAAGEKIRSEREKSYQQEIGNEYLYEQRVKGLFAGDEGHIADAAAAGEYSSYCAAVIGFDDGQDLGSDSGTAVRKFFDNMKNVDIVPVDINGVLGLLFKDWEYEAVKEALIRLNESLMGRAFIACGSSVRSPGEICRSYSEAKGIYANKFIFRHCGIAAPDLLKQSRDNDDTDYASQLYAYMEINDTEKLSRTLDMFMESMQTMDNTPEKARISCITLLMDIRSRIVRSASDKKPETLISDEFVSRISGLSSLRDIIEEMRKCLIGVSDACFSKTTKSNMERVVQYIRANYNRELRLEMLAGIFGYNSAYLGKVFHQYTGENFNNYLDEIRISEAKRLLAEEDYKVYEVAEMVGYSNINYFHNKFKKYVGVSPLSYKKSFGKDE
ncbi:MAG: response regulator transcription factor [Oscillospiraceae bacterium]|nr:response regulator transcription factor [Oscillospiraceae bacterium]MDY6207480.1 response regulator transcription factor [Oscillospiraceae bacterium]